MRAKQWNDLATRQLKAELTRQGVGYADLVRRLRSMGVRETYASVANKISRGAFSFAFFLQCMKALDRNDLKLIDDLGHRAH